MPVTMKSITNNLKYLERMTHNFAGDKTLRKAAVDLQLVLAATLVAVLQRQAELVSDKELTEEEMVCLKGKNRIGLIKLFRERFDLGLGEAKDKADETFVKHGYGQWHYQDGHKSFLMHQDND